MGFKLKIKRSSPRVLNSWILFVTLFIIVAANFVYWFVYVKNNDEQQISKRFRVLSQMSDNIYHKEKGLKNIAKENVAYAQKLLPQKTAANTESDVSGEPPNQNNNDESNTDETTEGMDSSSNDTMDSITNEPENIWDNKIYQAFYDIINEGIKEVDSLKLGKQDSLSSKNILELIAFEGMNQDTYSIYIEKDEFFNPLERSDVFDHLIVLGTTTDTDPEGKSISRPTLIYNSFRSDLEITDASLLKPPETFIHSGQIKKIIISDTEYMVFFQPLKPGKR